MSAKLDRPVKRTSSTKLAGSRTPKRTRVTIELPLPLPASEPGVILVTGAGDVGQLGLGVDVLEKSRLALVQINYDITDICAGGMHTVCLTKDGKVITFGCNDEGALGRNTSDEDAEFTAGQVELPEKAIQISAGDSHTAALLQDGRAFVWGSFRDSHGSMGISSSGNERLPCEILPAESIVKVSSGADHLVLLTKQGDLYTCGCAEQGQLGRTTERNSGRDTRAGIMRYLTPALVQTKLSLKLHFDDVWAGTYCTFAKVYGKNDIYVFGLNNYNQIGLSEAKTYFNPTLSTELSKYKWKQLCSAQHHTLALSEEGKTYAIGRKEYGRLGLGKECEDALILVEIPALSNHKCVHIGCGSSSSFAVTDKGEVYSWGMGTSGQLGTGEEDDCFEPTPIKSKHLVDRSAIKVSSGGQHTVVLAITKNNNNTINNTTK